MVGIVLLLLGVIAHTFMDTHALSYILFMGGAAMIYIQFMPHGITVHTADRVYSVDSIDRTNRDK